MNRAFGVAGLIADGFRRTGQLAKAGQLSALALLLATLAAGLAHGTTFAPKNFDQLVREAEVIFVGTVTATQSRKESTGGIVTNVTLDNLRIAKGIDTGPITLEALGGTVGEETLRLTGVPTFQVGVRYLVFMKGNGTAIFPVVGGPQGMFQVVQDPLTGVEMALDATGAPISNPGVRQAVLGGTGAEAAAQLVPPAPIPLHTFLQAITDRLGRP